MPCRAPCEHALGPVCSVAGFAEQRCAMAMLDRTDLGSKNVAKSSKIGHVKQFDPPKVIPRVR